MNRLALTIVALMVGGAALAQPPQGGFGGQGGPGGQGGFGGQGGGRGGGFPGGMTGGPSGMMNREVSAANIGLRILASYLNLNEAQVGKIALIREEAQDTMRPQMRRRALQ